MLTVNQKMLCLGAVHNSHTRSFDDQPIMVCDEEKLSGLQVRKDLLELGVCHLESDCRIGWERSTGK